MSDRATCQVLDVLYGFSSPHGVCKEFFLSFFLSIYLINHLTLAGIITASVETLPHVIKYQTVIPLRLKDSSVFNDAAATHKVTLTLLCC